MKGKAGKVSGKMREESASGRRGCALGHVLLRRAPSADHCIWLHQYWCRLGKSNLWRMMESTGEQMESVEANVDQHFEYFGSEDGMKKWGRRLLS